MRLLDLGACCCCCPPPAAATPLALGLCPSPEGGRWEIFFDASSLAEAAALRASPDGFGGTAGEGGLEEEGCRPGREEEGGEGGGAAVALCGVDGVEGGLGRVRDWHFFKVSSYVG